MFIAGGGRLESNILEVTDYLNMKEFVMTVNIDKVLDYGIMVKVWLSSGFLKINCYSTQKRRMIRYKLSQYNILFSNREKHKHYVNAAFYLKHVQRNLTRVTLFFFNFLKY